MPIINGKKMACAPCIRGHRSTKCNHGDERIMVMVKKPGRPLANCPCLPGKSCACGAAVKVAIPKKANCGGCPPKDQKRPTSGSGEISRRSSPSSNTQSPPENAFRVGKTPSALRGGRKLSFDPSNLHRIDPSTINMMPQFGMGRDTSSIMSPTTMDPYGVPPYMSADTSSYGAGASAGLGVPMAFQPVFNVDYGPLSMPTPYTNLPPNTQNIIKLEGLSSPYQGASDFNLGSPMLSSPPIVLNRSRHARASSLSGPVEYIASSAAPSMGHSAVVTNAPAASCCGGARASPDRADSVALMSPYSEQNGTQYTMQPAMKQQSAQAPVYESTEFTYPAQYGSWNHPIDQHTWQQIASASQPSMEALPMPDTSNITALGQGFSHQCNCGPGCQCLGCLAHPFNEQTYKYVSSAYVDVNGHSTPSTPSINGSNGMDPNSGFNGNGLPARHKSQRSDTNVSQTSDGPTPGSCCSNGSSVATTAQTPALRSGSPTAPTSRASTPSEGSGLGEDQQNLSELNFLWVSLDPRADAGCHGLMASCPCGDDCECVGCILHNPPTPS